MKVYEVISTNLDVQDGYFCNVLFQDIETAKAYCRKELENKQAKNVTEDFEGKLEKFQDKSLEYTVCNGNPAIYYNSHFGNYRCVVFIKTRQVY